MKISMVGHSTVLIETAGRRILTDPFFGLHGNVAYKRLRPPAWRREELTKIDLVLVSHNHFDHTDGLYFRALPLGVPVVAPSKTAWMTRLKGARNVTGMRVWEKHRFNDISITAVPAVHSTVTRGYVIESVGRRVYFAGDTYFAPFMEKIAQDFRPQVVLMPVSTFRLPLTMGEEAAVAAAKLLRPEVVIPIHLGITPRMPHLRGSGSPERFIELMQRAGLRTQVALLGEGESWSDTTPDHEFATAAASRSE